MMVAGQVVKRLSEELLNALATSTQVGPTHRILRCVRLQTVHIYMYVYSYVYGSSRYMDMPRLHHDHGMPPFWSPTCPSAVCRWRPSACRPFVLSASSPLRTANEKDTGTTHPHHPTTRRPTMGPSSSCLFASVDFHLLSRIR